ncbi:MAG: hemerythrin domain-containing protein [Gammaproteobacteria bacterium]|nr:hemerythrin domain-containing protein [Gammaproteobacteria bacterium]
MVDVAEFSRENQELTDLCAVLDVLIADPDMRGNPVFCELLSRFSEKIRAHLDHEDRAMYAELLSHEDKSINEVATRFINNTHQLRTILSSYIKRWCHATRGGDATGHDEFTQETREIFALVSDRINLEKSKLFPLFL